jgi:hypothetical protein
MVEPRETTVPIHFRTFCLKKIPQKTFQKILAKFPSIAHFQSKTNKKHPNFPQPNKKLTIST